MSLRQLLGLDVDFTDEEIVQQMSEARKKQQECVEFIHGKKHVTVHFNYVDPHGIIKWQR